MNGTRSQPAPTLQAPVEAVLWRPGVDNELLFGLADGSVHLGRTAQNKSHELYRHPGAAPVAAMAALPPRGSDVSAGVLVGHADGAICRYVLDASSGAPAGVSTICRHTCAPTALACNGEALLCGGADLRVASYTLAGRVTATVELAAAQPELQSLFCAAVPPAGDTAVVGAFNALLVFEYEAREQVRRSASLQAHAPQLLHCDAQATATLRDHTRAWHA